MTATAVADQELILDVVYGEYRAVPRRLLSRHVWVMDPAMLRFLRILTTRAGELIWSPPTAIGGRLYLLGIPVELRDGAVGARLEYRP